LEKQFKKIKILFTIPNFDTAGSGRALLNIALNLNKNLYNPLICCSHSKGEFFENVKKSGIKIYIHQTTHSMIPRFSGIYKCLSLAKFFRKLKPDIIHSFHYGADYSEGLASRIAGIPWIYTKKNMNWGGNSKNGWALRSFFASKILVQNKDMFKFFPNENKVHLVPRGVDTKVFKPRSKCGKIIDKYDLGVNEKIIMTVSNLIPVKNIEFLIEAFDFMLKSNSNLRLIIVGDKNNEYGKKLVSETYEKYGNQKIIFTGKDLNVHEYLSVADIFVLPTNEVGEGCPVALLEALATGLVVIGSDVPGIKDVLAPFKSNLFTNGDKTDLINKLNFHLNHQNIRMIKKQIRHVDNNFSLGVETYRHQKIYQTLLKN